MRNMKKILALATFSLILDVVALIAIFAMIFSLHNIWFIIFLGLILYIIGWDTFKAASFIAHHYKR